MNDEFKPIPGYPDYEISKSGIIRNILTGKIKKSKLTKSGYYMVSLRDHTGAIRNTGQHRLLALAFLPLPDNYQSMVINHKDGIKNNNHLSNLEWCSHRENMIHAGYMGLSPKSKPIEVRNVISGETWVFDCFADAAKHFGISKYAISWRVSRGENHVDDLFNQYRTHTRIGKPWLEPEIWGDGILLRNAITKEITRFPSQIALSEYLSISPGYISRFINDKKQSIFRAKDSLYQIIPFTLNPVWVDYECPYKEYERRGGRKCLVMYNPEKEEPKIWLSSAEAAYAYGYGRNVTFWRARQHRTEPWPDGLICHYLYP